MSVIVYCDGSSKGQGVVKGVDGQGAVGVVIYKDNKLIGKYARGIGRATNNHAELEAILTALMLCWANPELVDPIIYTDSQLAAKLVNGEWFCMNAGLRPTLLSIQEIQEIFRCRVIQVPRLEVAEADKLAKAFQTKLQNRLELDDVERKKYYRLKKKNSRRHR